MPESDDKRIPGSPDLRLSTDWILKPKIRTPGVSISGRHNGKRSTGDTGIDRTPDPGQRSSRNALCIRKLFSPPVSAGFASKMPSLFRYTLHNNLIPNLIGPGIFDRWYLLQDLGDAADSQFVPRSS